MAQLTLNQAAAAPNSLKRYLAGQAVPWGVFLLAVGWLLIRPMGLHLSVMPGVYGDTRLINFILEHFFNLVTGVEKSLWNTYGFYPYPLTLAFSDNLLGVAPFYIPFRLAGLDQETSLQAWFLLGFLMNYAACVLVLSRLRFPPVAVAVGAFFFTFGLPMLAHLSRLQLLYRPGVPLAGYALWQFAKTSRPRYLAGLILAAVYQLYAGVYIGVLLCLLLAAMLLVIPFFFAGQSIGSILSFWPGRLKLAWMQSGNLTRAAVLLIVFLAGAALIYLFQPYWMVQRIYGFGRDWDGVAALLPRIQSYFVADQLGYWKPVSMQLWGMSIMRNEHQLFIGWGMLVLVIISLAAGLRSHLRPMVLVHFSAVALLVILTLNVNGLTLYRLIYELPGMDSIRFVTRVQLVMMWPLALLAAVSVEWIMGKVRRPVPALGIALLLVSLVLFEPALWKNNLQFVKRHARERLEELRAQLPASPPEDPVLFLAVRKDESFVISETDGMLLAQDLGWPTFNGYFGNFPPGYQPAESCRELPARIINYMHFAGITSEAYYLGMIRRAVPVGFQDCDPSWWVSMPK